MEKNQVFDFNQTNPGFMGQLNLTHLMAKDTREKDKRLLKKS